MQKRINHPQCFYSTFVLLRNYIISGKVGIDADSVLLIHMEKIQRRRPLHSTRFTFSHIRHKLSFGRILLNLFLLALVAFTSLPIVYAICTAFKPLHELLAYPPRFFVRNPTLSNFADLFLVFEGSEIPFTRYIFNSLSTTIIIVILNVLFSSTGAYGLVKHKVPCSNLLFSIIVAALMFSTQVTQIPTYMLVNKMHLIDTYASLIITKIAVAYNFFLMKQFLEQFPNDLLEAARLDGAGEWKIFFSIVMPSVKPAWSTLVVFSFVNNWNDYFTPLIYTRSQALKTLPLALQSIGTGVAVAGAVAAATLIMIVPTILVFTLMQSKVMETMTYSGIKS